MTPKELEKVLGELHTEVALALVMKVKEGLATPQDISNAIKLLSHNGITCEVHKGTPLDILEQEILPFAEGHTVRSLKAVR